MVKLRPVAVLRKIANDGVFKVLLFVSVRTFSCAQIQMSSKEYRVFDLCTQRDLRMMQEE